MNQRVDDKYIWLKTNFFNIMENMSSNYQDLIRPFIIKQKFDFVSVLEYAKYLRKKSYDLISYSKKPGYVQY
jgi:hypothetical protein